MIIVNNNIILKKLVHDILKSIKRIYIIIINFENNI